MEEQKIIAGPVKGYKMTDDNMQCRGFQFELGTVHELENNEPLVGCRNGFHFCKAPSGVWAYHSSGRLFEVECYDVLDTPEEPGAEYKQVCRKVKFVKEILFDGYSNTGNMNTGNWNTGYRNTGNCNTGNRNTGYRNTGYRNTGNCNTGNRNTGYRNTGDWNIGDCNTGDRNTGYRNTGDWNIGDWNTGDWNTGDWNTGYSNTGDRNTGYRNTGDWNIGDWNITNRASGLLNTKERLFVLDIVCKTPFEDIDHNLVNEFGRACESDKEFDYSQYLEIPNATIARLKAYHKKAIEQRAKDKTK